MSNKYFMGRSSMIGDNLSALPTATYIKKIDPDAYITWVIGKKCSSFAPLLINHPDLDKIFVLDGEESMESNRDWNEFYSNTFQYNINPQHLDNKYPKERNIYLESFLMQGFSEKQWAQLTPEEQIPKLVKWWQPVKRPFGDKKTIFFTGMPNFGRESKRWVSKQYLEKLVLRLVRLGYCVIQSGGEQDETWFSGQEIEDISINSLNYKRVNELSFFDQIKIANECDCIVGSDSGMSLVCGAYSLQQVSLIPIHWGNENNPSALSTNNPNNYSFYSINGTDNIDIEEVITKVQEKIGNS